MFLLNQLDWMLRYRHIAQINNSSVETLSWCPAPFRCYCTTMILPSGGELGRLWLAAS